MPRISDACFPTAHSGRLWIQLSVLLGIGGIVTPMAWKNCFLIAKNATAFLEGNRLNSGLQIDRPWGSRDTGKAEVTLWKAEVTRKAEVDCTESLF